MENFNKENIIKHHALYHRFAYAILIFLSIALYWEKNEVELGNIIMYCLVFGVFLVLDVVMLHFSYLNSIKVFSRFRIAEIFAYCILLPNIQHNAFWLICSVYVVILMLAVEFMEYGTGKDFDASTITVKKIFVGIAIGLNVMLAYRTRTDYEWVNYALVAILILIVVFFVVDWLLLSEKEFREYSNRLLYERSNMEKTNEKLIDYQERVKAINEQINFQKIDLNRMIKELEQVNRETEAQNNLMSFMASTFDVVKCINVLTDTVVDTMNVKICGLFIEKDIFLNKEPAIVIRTNYSSMEHRLRKEFPSIYRDMKNNIKRSHIVSQNYIEDYKFVGDTSLCTFAMIPIMDGNNIYGMMLVGSDQSKFFEKGLSFYETCLVELNIAVKSAALYLKTQDISRKDGLTGIYNRVYFMELFGEVSKKATQNKKSLSVALFDIDKFKSVNDTYGHLMGDEVIKMVARVAAKYAEQYDGFSCRYGGEEFLVVLPEKDQNDTLPILEKMHDEIRNTIVTYKDTSLSVNVSIGYSTYPELCKDVDLLVSRADKAMYYSKEHGRGRLIVDNDQL